MRRRTEERLLNSSVVAYFFFSSRRRHTRLTCDWSSDVCSSDLDVVVALGRELDVDGVGVAEQVVEVAQDRSEERRVGKECRCRGSPYHYYKKADATIPPNSRP